MKTARLLRSAPGLLALALLVLPPANLPARPQDHPDSLSYVAARQEAVLYKSLHQVAVQALAQNPEAERSEVLMAVAQARLGTPYVAGSIEMEPERLVVNLHATDCILFVESCLALCQDARDPRPSFDNLCRHLRRLRYRDGQVAGYASRLHYTSEWILQAQEQGYLTEVSADLPGAAPWSGTFRFMSSHPKAYPALAKDPAQRSLIAQAEARLNARQYHYLPKDACTEAVLDKLHEGDILCFVTSVDGLDIGHVGLACRRPDGRMGLLHASSKAGSVVLDPLPLEAYLAAGKHIGLRILRIV